MKVFELVSPVCIDSPTYDALASSSMEKGRELRFTMFAPDAYAEAVDVPVLGPEWEGHEVIRVKCTNKNRRKPHDSCYPCVDMIIPAFRRDFADRLSSMLSRDGQLIGLNCSEGDFVMFNPLKQLDMDAIDPKNTKIDMGWSLKTKRRDLKIADKVEAVAFQPERLRDVDIFRFRPMTQAVLVTERFVEEVRRVGGKGVFIRAPGSMYQEVEIR